MKFHPSIGESLTVLTELAGVPLGGLDDDQIDIVAARLRLIASHTAGDARTGIYLVPRRPEVEPPPAFERTTRGSYR